MKSCNLWDNILASSYPLGVARCHSRSVARKASFSKIVGKCTNQWTCGRAKSLRALYIYVRKISYIFINVYSNTTNKIFTYSTKILTLRKSNT